MTKKSFVARCDDLGSNHSANRAIDLVTRAGFFKNVSVMACGPALAEAAELLAHRKDLCFGMHTTLNAEWDKVKWGPLSPLGPESGLVDEQGWFLNDPALFLQTRPAVETILKEVSAQLDRLQRAGFDIRYVDSHMFPEAYVPGLDEAMAEFIRRKGLVDHMYFYRLPPGLAQLGDSPAAALAALAALPAGQYFLLTHPALDTEEMRQTGNAQVRGEDVARARAQEATLFADPAVTAALHGAGCEGVRYDRAAFDRRLTVEDVTHLLAGASADEGGR